MKNKISLLSLLILLTLGSIIHAQVQMPKWCLPPYIVDFTGTTPISNPLPGWTSGTANTEASNAAFDNSGNLLFYVVRNKVYDAMGVYITDISGNLYGPKEAGIFKVPGYCNRYYLISVLSLPYSPAKLYYSMIDANSSGVSIVSGQHNIEYTGAGWFFEFAQVAVSQLRTDGTRFLYVSGYDNLCKYVVTSTGITYNSVIANSSTGLSFRGNELDLNHTGDKLAWGSNGLSGSTALVNVINLNSNGDFASAQTYSIPDAGARVFGTEFNSTGTQLFTSSFDYGTNYVNAGINSIDLTVAPTSFVHIAGSEAFASSQLELAFDGKIYASSGLNLGSVDPLTNTFNSTALPISVVFTLPDQIDGQDYQIQTGPPDFWVSDGMDSWSTVPDDGTEPQSSISWDGDIWNCENDPNCTQNENPEYKLFGNNFMRVRVQNRGCEASVPTTADLHLYWTRGRSGEIWDGHWLDPILRPLNTINGNAAGGEITANQATAVSIPIDIPAIPAGGSVILTQSWKPPHPSNFAGGPGPVDGNQNPMICFLARVESGIDPMYLEQYTGIADNVKNNNNIATRNTYLVDLNPINIFDWAGSIGINHTNVEDAMVHLEFSAAPLQSPFEGVGTIKLQLSPSLWEVWMAAGARGENIEIIDDEKHIVQVLNPQYASLQGLNLNPDTEYSLLPGFGLNEGIQGEQFFQFRINMLDVNTGEYGSANTYDVRISEDCKINLLNEVSTTPGQCVTIGRDFGCSNCAYNWTPANGLSNPHGPITEACPNRTTTYLLSVVDESTGCESSDKVTVYVLEETGERAFTTIPTTLLSAVKLFPNPADQRFQCSFEAAEAKSQTFVMTNSLGQIVLQNTLLAVKGENWFEFEVSQLPAGVYRIQIGEGLLTETLVIKR